MRVRNIFICSEVVFCASSRMMKASFRVRPRMNAIGATSMIAALQELGRLLVAQDVVERVVEGPQVRVDLLDEVARQEAELLAGFHGRPGEDDALDLLLEQGRRRHRHGEVGLAGPGRADREDQVVAVDRLDVDPLLDVADRDDGLQGRAEGALGEELRQRGRRVLRTTRMAVATSPPLQGVALRPAGPKDPPEGGVRHPGPGPLPDDRDLAAASLEADAEGVFDGPQVFVGDSEERSQSGFGQGYGVIRVRNRRCSLRR